MYIITVIKKKINKSRGNSSSKIMNNINPGAAAFAMLLQQPKQAHQGSTTAPPLCTFAGPAPGVMNTIPSSSFSQMLPVYPYAGTIPHQHYNFGTAVYSSSSNHYAPTISPTFYGNSVPYGNYGMVNVLGSHFNHQYHSQPPNSRPLHLSSTVGGLLSTLPLAKPNFPHAAGNNPQSNKNTNGTLPWMNFSTAPTNISILQAVGNGVMIAHQHGANTSALPTTQHSSSQQVNKLKSNENIHSSSGDVTQCATLHSTKLHHKTTEHGQNRKDLRSNRKQNKLGGSRNNVDTTFNNDCNPPGGPYRKFSVEGQSFSILVSNDQHEVDEWIKQRKSRFPTKLRVDLKTERSELQSLCGGTEHKTSDKSISQSVSTITTLPADCVNTADNRKQDRFKRKRESYEDGPESIASHQHHRRKTNSRSIEKKSSNCNLFETSGFSEGLFDKLVNSAKIEEENIILQCIHFLRQEILIMTDEEKGR